MIQEINKVIQIVTKKIFLIITLFYIICFYFFTYIEIFKKKKNKLILLFENSKDNMNLSGKNYSNTEIK